ncbi:MAG: lipopolysaccharide assembly protein LapA domain-containing protein, partial [Deferrisomatales bacterium]
MIAFIRKMLFAVLVAALVVFAYQNLQALSQGVQFQFDLYLEGFRYQAPELPVVFLLVVCVLAGMVASGFHGVYERWSRRAELRRRDKRIRELEKELAGLREQVAELRPPPEAGPPDVEALPAPRGETPPPRGKGRGSRDEPPRPPRPPEDA